MKNFKFASVVYGTNLFRQFLKLLALAHNQTFFFSLDGNEYRTTFLSPENLPTYIMLDKDFCSIAFEICIKNKPIFKIILFLWYILLLLSLNPYNRIVYNLFLAGTVIFCFFVFFFEIFVTSNKFHRISF